VKSEKSKRDNGEIGKLVMENCEWEKGSNIAILIVKKTYGGNNKLNKTEIGKKR
jgi:hypothetical protein